jgi:hypothetical protein
MLQWRKDITVLRGTKPPLLGNFAKQEVAEERFGADCERVGAPPFGVKSDLAIFFTPLSKGRGG